ncbi:hypothetical protein ON010_g3634 [Phytophthora cinnamomi]|nr:hypothetical protein ON010_g3634 [Phytophthora cinnamomi]
MAETSPLLGRSSPLKRELPQLHALPSIMHAMGGYPLETSSMPKRARMGSDVGLDVQASYSLLGHMPRQAMIYPSIPQQQHYHQGATTYAPATEVQSPSNAGSSSPGALGLPANSSVSVWDTVLSTGKFPTDVSLSEHGSGAASPTTPFNVNKNRSNSEDATESAEAETSSEVKQGRWTADEEQYASSLIRAVNSGEVVLPPNVSVRKFIADSLQCKTMRVSKKFRSLGSSPRGAPEEEPVSPRDESFNPLSLKSIMNNESSAAVLVSDVLNVAEAMANPNVIRPSPSIRSGKKSTQRVLKRSDYSQHGRVRSGRWSMEEENYAKAMIEAFKAGYLPLHGNVSLRKFLSEVLVCHPMRISKKFVGYVRKYHWYRIAAGKCDPEAKRQALYQLSHLERVFWRSLQQNSEWSTGLRRDDYGPIEGHVAQLAANTIASERKASSILSEALSSFHYVRQLQSTSSTQSPGHAAWKTEARTQTSKLAAPKRRPSKHAAGPSGAGRTKPSPSSKSLERAAAVCCSGRAADDGVPSVGWRSRRLSTPRDLLNASDTRGCSSADNEEAKQQWSPPLSGCRRANSAGSSLGPQSSRLRAALAGKKWHHRQGVVVEVLPNDCLQLARPSRRLSPEGRQVQRWGAPRSSASACRSTGDPQMVSVLQLTPLFTRCGAAPVIISRAWHGMTGKALPSRATFLPMAPLESAAASCAVEAAAALPPGSPVVGSIPLATSNALVGFCGAPILKCAYFRSAASESDLVPSNWGAAKSLSLRPRLRSHSENAQLKGRNPPNMRQRAEWPRRLLARAGASSSQRLASSRPARGCHRPVPRRSRSLLPLSVAVGAGAAALALTSSPDNAQRLRSTAHMGALVLHESEADVPLEDAMALATKWGEILRRGGLQAAQDELLQRLLSCILRLEDDEQSQETLRFLLERGALPLLVQYTARNKPTEPRRLQQLVQSYVKLLEAATRTGQTELHLSLVTLAQTLAHLKQQQDDTVNYVDMLQLGAALTKVQQLAHERLEEGADASRAFAVYRSDLEDSDFSRVAESCTALVELCSPEMPDSMKKFGLWSMSTLVQAVGQEDSSALRAKQLEAALGPKFATNLLELPRSGDEENLQLQAATVLDRLLHVARQYPATVSRGTYELWMKQLHYWTGAEQQEEVTKPKNLTWLRRKSGRPGRFEDEKAKTVNERLQLQLQLISSRCLRTLTASPQSRRYVCESSRTRAALFSLSRQIHERKQRDGNPVDEDTARMTKSIQRHLSWTFRNICTGFQSGAMALNCLFDASWTASLLQSRRDLPMSRFFRGVNDLTDLPIIGAEEYEASVEFGWVDILTAWSSSTDHQVRENAITSLIFLAEQKQSTPAGLMSEEEAEIRNKQEHILQAWLTNMLQQMRILSGGELLAVKQMEDIAHVSKELTPGNERILFNPAVVDAGTSALAVLAEHHHTELVQQGVVPLVALLSATRLASPAQHTQCARVLANLVATYCLDIDPRTSALSNPPRSMISSDHVDIAKLLDQTVSGKQFLGDIRRWCEIEDPMQRSNYFRVVENLRAYDEVVATGHLAKDVYCEGVHPIVSQGIVEQCTDDEPAMPKVDVVFVHGLRGHPFGTWRTDMSNKLEGTNDIWPDVLLARDLQRSGVPARLVTLGYEAGMVSWSSPWPSLTLQERARVMLSALYAAYIGRCRPNAPARPVIFITHSMGGLLTKQMLLVGREQRVRSSLADNTAGVVFLAVPHFGSDLAKGVRSESIRKLIQAHPAIADLGADPNGRLKDLNDSFKQLGIDCFSVGEERAAPVALGLSAVVVKPESADPGIGRFYVLPDSDHMTICKAKSREEPLYQDILAQSRGGDAGVAVVVVVTLRSTCDTRVPSVVHRLSRNVVEDAGAPTRTATAPTIAPTPPTRAAPRPPPFRPVGPLGSVLAAIELGRVD